MSDSSMKANHTKSQHSRRRDYIERPFLGNEFITFVDVDYGGRSDPLSRGIGAYETRPDGRLVAGSKRARAYAIAKEAQTLTAEMDVDIQPEGNIHAESKQV
ncbi:hypothetical protein H2248_003819 [Termitomyces sp. 'cryptogamus']|nr:hypothetical protein H2248_003819 [Termitomyces sp. 'cryptogamus']